jgi:transcriptional regulator with XRE-family HTH domain
MSAWRPGHNQGETNFRAKLTKKDVTYIFLCEDLTQLELAAKFKVSQSTINHIKTGRTWQWLTSNLDK